MHSLSLLPSWEYVNKTSVLLLLFFIWLSRLRYGSNNSICTRFVAIAASALEICAGLVSYDFYIDRIYRLTVVFAVNLVSQCSAWLDRYVVDGVNFVGLASIFRGNLKVQHRSIPGLCTDHSAICKFFRNAIELAVLGISGLDYISKI